MSRHYLNWFYAQLTMVCVVYVTCSLTVQRAQASRPPESLRDDTSSLSNHFTTLTPDPISLPPKVSKDQRLQPATALLVSQAEDSVSQMDAEEHREALSPETDPDLGILRVYPESERDPDLGVLRLQPAQPESPPPPVVYFTASSSAIFSDNALSSDEPIDDGIFRAGIGLRAVPALGDRTYAVLTANGNIVRYADAEQVNYDELELGASLFHRITRRAYVDVGWKNEQLFRESGDRFLSDHQLRATIGRRDQIGRLQVNTAYQLQRSFADPERRSRLLNRLRLSAQYPLQADLDLGISYQLALVDFTESDRNDHYQQILAQLSYQPSPETRISLFGGGRFGDSDLDRIDFDSVLFGVSFGVNLPLF
ncbi:MAG: hypothetical protein WBA10_20655 [Elainellaceae cyanobacterium]